MPRIRPIIEVRYLPPGQTESDWNRLRQEILAAVMSVQELGLKNEDDVIDFLWPAPMLYGRRNDIVIKITRLSLPGKPGRIGEIRQRLARIVGSKVKEFYPNARVECSAASLDPSEGFWSSVDNERP